MNDLEALPATLQRAPQRLRVYEFILTEMSSGRPFPSYRQIIDHMGWVHETSAQSALTNLWRLDKVLVRDLHTREWRLAHEAARP